MLSLHSSKNISALCLLLAVFSTEVSSANAPGGAKYDRNRNGLIDKGRELSVYIRHMASPILKEFDANLNGILDADEAKSFNSKITNSDAFFTARGDIEDKLGADDGLKVVAGPTADSPDKLADTQGILVRKAYEPISAFALPKKFVGAGAATFAYKHDFTAGNNVATANGVIAAYKHWNVNTDYKGDVRAMRPTRVALHGGLEFDQKLDQKNPSKEIDIVTIRAGGEVELSGGLFDAQYFRTSLADTTNSHLRSHVASAELEWEPVINILGIGNARRFGSSSIAYRWRPVLHAEYQDVLDADGDVSLKAQDGSTRLGPIVSAEIWFEDGPFAGLSFDASYRHLFDVRGSADVKYFDVGAEYALDSDGHFTISTRYRNGNTPKGNQKIEDLTVGLGIKF